MNNDGWGQMGSGASDMRIEGEDLQHYRQGGPIREHLASETKRHEKSEEHRQHHLEKHAARGYNSQHGHDDYKY
jgi:hypothetical protein